MKAVRLDKFLALSGERSRSESTQAIRSGYVKVNGNTIRNPSEKVRNEDIVLLNGEVITDRSLQYYLFFKPSGVLTASKNNRTDTVMDYVPDALSKREVYPVGRLDKDTTGLLLLTNDGGLAHRLLDPKHHVWKRYTAVVEGFLSQQDVSLFASGIELSDFTAKPAKLTILSADREKSTATVELREGKFHQVKRMFSYCGHEVLFLHRDAFGPLSLPENMKPGEFRELTDEEICSLRAAVYSKDRATDDAE